MLQLKESLDGKSKRPAPKKLSGKEFAAKQRLLYSGGAKKRGNRNDRQKPTFAADLCDPSDAVNELQSRGFLKMPS